MTPHHDYAPAVDDLIRAHDGQPPLRPPRVVPPRPLPRHLTNPAPARRWGTDLATVNRHRRVRPALGRVVAAIAKRREAV